MGGRAPRAGRAARRTTASAGRKLRSRPVDDDRRRPRSPTGSAAFRMGAVAMSSPKLDRERAALVVIDVQEGFRKRDRRLRRSRPGDRDDGPRRAALGAAGRRHRAVPEGPGRDRRRGRRAPAGGQSSRSRRPASAPPPPTASTSAAATRRSSAGSRPTSASTRPSSTCSTRGTEVHVVADAVGSRSRREPGARSAQGRARGRLADQRRDGALRAARRGRQRRASRRSSASSWSCAP